MGHPVYFRSDARIMPGTAEPRIEITGELLGLFERWPKDDARLKRPADGRVVGSVLRMDYQGTLLLYRITAETYPGDECHRPIYAAEWPD
jgi:hypothetical protein